MNSTNMEQIFSSIYKNCLWGSNGNSNYQGSSGDGSSPEYNIEYIDFIKKYDLLEKNFEDNLELYLSLN